MISTSPKVLIYLGRHQSASSGLWIYGISLLKSLLADLPKQSRLQNAELQCVYGGEGDLLDTLRSLGADERTFKIKSLPSFPGSRRLSLLLDMLWVPPQVDVVHGTANVIPILGRAKKILSLHDLLQAFPVQSTLSFYDQLRVYWYRQYLRLLVRRADIIITDHSRTKQEIITRFSPTSTIEVVYPTLASVYLQTPLPKERALNGGFLAFASRDPRKNIEQLLEGFIRFQEFSQANQGDTHIPRGLTIVANSEDTHKKIDSLIAKLPHGLRDLVVVRTNVPLENMGVLYASSYALLYPSLAEGFGYPIYEALSQGVPVLCNKSNIIDDLYGQLEDAVVDCADGSAANITAGLLKLTQTKDFTRRSEVAKLVRETLDGHKSAAKIFALYQDLL